MDRNKSPPEFRESLHGLPYEQTVLAEPPIRVKSSTSPHRVASEIPETNVPTKTSASVPIKDDGGFLRPTTLSGSSATNLSAKKSSGSLVSSSSIPQIKIDSDSMAAPQDALSQHTLQPSSSKTSDQQQRTESFLGIALNLPGGSLSEEIPTEKMEFSKRGSMLIGGEKINDNDNNARHGLQSHTSSRRVRSNPSMRNTPSRKLLSVEEETLSQKVRAFYEAGAEIPSASDVHASLVSRIGLRWQDALNNIDESSTTSLSRATSITDVRSDKSATPSILGGQESVMQREENELAGGVEDWQDVDNKDVDRYGFIAPKSPTASSIASDGKPRSATSRESQGLQRLSTSLQMASEAPRPSRSVKRTRSHTHGSAGLAPNSGIHRQQSESPRIRPTAPQSAGGSLSRRSTMWHAANKLPHNKDRKLMDEAGDMLTLPPSAQGAAELDQVPYDGRARRKETEREEKWRKMARVVSNNSGGGMIFDFDTSNAKLIERTWKGIPDRWRATAWHAFLSASARRRNDSPTDDTLIKLFHDYTSQSSPDDVQIDIDVPRTISSHIMFRRRYRGGQRLLFRVLHAMSLHFPETGYVQGMATLAATLLAYYEEERAFVMLVRLWDLRGLDKLYRSGFGGLMRALSNFEKEWLGSGELATKLTELGIDPTAYGTRWYLTLFNYSIPFPAQLRVWDVFMLLGDGNITHSTGEDESFGSTLDVLHATSAALIDGMREILLESDFENAMTVLTSWIPIRDEDLFMKVAKAEWKLHKRKG